MEGRGSVACVGGTFGGGWEVSVCSCKGGQWFGARGRAENPEGKFAGQVSAQCCCHWYFLYCHVLPLLGTAAADAHLVSTAVRSPALAVGRAVSLVGSFRPWEMEVFRDSDSGFGIRDPSQACALLTVRCCVWRSVGVPPLLSMLGVW